MNPEEQGYDSDEELRLAIEMSLREAQGGDNNNDDNDNETKEEKKEEEKEIEEVEDVESNKFVQQFTINCICSRALTGTYESDHILDEIISSEEDDKKKEDEKDVRGLLDTAAEEDESKKKLIEGKDVKLISALPLFTRLAIQNLNKIAEKGSPNLSNCVNFTLFVLKAYKNAVTSSVYLVTREFCPLLNVQKINAFFTETIGMFFEVMSKYTTVLEINGIRTALLDIVMCLFVENKSVTSVCNILTVSDAKELKKLMQNPETKVIDNALSQEKKATKEAIQGLISEDLSENEGPSEEKDFFNENIEEFTKRNGLEIVLDHVIDKLIKNQKENNYDDDEDDDDIEEAEEKKFKPDEGEQKEEEEEEGLDTDDDDLEDDKNAQDDFYGSVFSFLKFFSYAYKGFITKNEGENETYKQRMEAINSKILAVSSAVILGNIQSEGYLPPFPLILVVFKVFSDALTYGNIAKADSLKTLKALFAHRAITEFNKGSEEGDSEWAEYPLSKNTLSVLTYAIEALSSAIADYKKASAAESQAVVLAQEKIGLACSSAAEGEFKHLGEVLEQGHSAVLSALKWGDDGESIVDALITASSNLSGDMPFINEESSESAALPKLLASLPNSEISSKVSDGYLLDSLFHTDSSQDSLQSEAGACCTDMEDNLCKACAKIYGMCKKLVATTPSPKGLDALVTFAQNISPNDNALRAESGAFARHIKNKKNYQQLATAFREYTRALLVADSKNGASAIGEAVVKKVFERFPLFGPLECVLMTARFWALRRLRPNTPQGSVPPPPIAAETLRKFVSDLASTALAGTSEKCLELVNYERAEEILFVFNCCLDKESRVEAAVFALGKLAEAAQGASSLGCAEALIALGRLTDFATYFAVFAAKAPAAFASSVAENVLERRSMGSPAEEAYPHKMSADKTIIFERNACDLEVQPYYLFVEDSDERSITEEPIARCVGDSMPALVKIVGCGYEGCSASLKMYFDRLTYSFFMKAFATKPGDVWVDTLMSGAAEFGHKDVVLLLLVATFADTDSAALVQKFVAKAFEVLPESDMHAAFGLLLFVLSALETASPAAKGKDVARADKPVALFDKLAAADGHKESTAEQLVARMDVPVGLVPLAAKAEFDWGSKIDTAIAVAKGLLDKYIAHIAGANAAKLKAFIYSGLSLGDEVAAALVPGLEAYRTKFASVATLKSLAPEGPSKKPGVKDAFICAVLSAASETDAGLVLGLSLNMAAVLVVRMVLAVGINKASLVMAVARECLVLDNFKFADYGVFYDTLISANKMYAVVAAGMLWEQFASPAAGMGPEEFAALVNNDSVLEKLLASPAAGTGPEEFAALVNNDAVLEKLLALHKLYPNKGALYRLFVAYNGGNVQKIAGALLKEGKRRVAGDKTALVNAIKASGQDPEGEAVVRGIVKKLLAAGGNDVTLFLCDMVRESAGNGELTAFANRVYTTMLNLVDDKDAIAEISPKTYFTTIQTVSFRCARLLDLFKFAVKKLRAATSSMKVEENNDNNNNNDDDDDDYVYPYVLIIGSVIRMLALSEGNGNGEGEGDGKNGEKKVDPNMFLEPDEAKVKSALEKMAKNMPYWGCPEKDPSVVCTYTNTGKNFATQTWYYCKTCRMIGKIGCCAPCAAKCHNGHELGLGRFSSPFYCDCGAGASPTGKKCISCSPASSKDSSAMDVEDENGASNTTTTNNNNSKYNGLYDISKLSAECVAKLRVDVLSQDTFAVLLEYFNSTCPTLISKINSEASEDSDAAGSGSDAATVAAAALASQGKEDSEATVIAKPTPSSCNRSNSTDLATNLKTGSVSFSLPRLSGTNYESAAPNVSNYASSAALFRKDAMAIIARDSLKVLALREILVGAGQRTLGTLELPITPAGIAFHPSVPDLMVAFSEDECHVLVFAAGKYDKISHQAPVALPQGGSQAILNAFWLPAAAVAGPFLCVVTQRSVLVYNVTESTDEPAWEYASDTSIAGAVCVKAEIASAAQHQELSAKATFVLLRNNARSGKLSALCVSGLGTDAVNARTAAIDSDYVEGEQVALYYARALGMLLLTSFRNGEVTGYHITVHDDGEGEFNVERGPRLSVLKTALVHITEAVVGGVGVISGVTRDRTSAVTVAVGSEITKYSVARVGSSIAGSMLIASDVEGKPNKYLFVLQASSRIGVSTVNRDRVMSTSLAQLVKADAESKKKKKEEKEKQQEQGSEDKKDSAELSAGKGKKGKAKGGAEPITYTYLPRSAPEMSEGAVYTMIRGEPSSYVIEGDILSEISSTAARDKLREPEDLDYGRCGVVSQKRGEYKLRVVNRSSTRVITGLQIGLAHRHRSNVPEYVSVLGRRIAVPPKENLCLTIAFTLQEVLCAQSYVTIHFGPAKGGLEKIYIDYVTPFFTEKRAFGLPQGDDWPTKRAVTTAAGATEARYTTAATAAAGSLVASLRGLDALAPDAADSGSFIDAVLRVFTAVPGKVAERFRLLDVIEARIKRAPAFVASAVATLLPILADAAPGASEESRAAQLGTIAGFLEKVLASEPEAAFGPIVAGGVIPRLCAAAQAVKSPRAIARSGFVGAIVSLLFAAQVAVLARSESERGEASKALVDATAALLLAPANPALRNECARAIGAHFAEMSDGYQLSSEASAAPTKDFAACLRDASAQHGGSSGSGSAELLLAAARRLSLAPRPVAPGRAVRAALCLAPNTLDFCAWELQSLLAALPAPGELSEPWDGRLVPALYTVLQLAVRAIRAAALCRPRRYVEELCGAVVKSLLPAQRAAEFLGKALMTGLPAAPACYTVLRLATVAAIIRECARSSSPATHEAVGWLAKSLPSDFAEVVYEFMDAVFLPEYERLSRVQASDLAAAAANKPGAAAHANFIPPECLNIKPTNTQQSQQTSPDSLKESWKPLLSDAFVAAQGGSAAITSFLYAKRLYIATLYLARKAAGTSAGADKGRAFDEERWAELIGRSMVQSKLRFAYPSLLRLARSILSSEAALYSRIDKVGQGKLAALLEALSARTDRFARAPGAEDQGRLLELLYGQLAVTIQRPWSWRAHGLGHPATAPLLFRLVIGYAQNRRVRKDIVSISLALLGELLDMDNKEGSVLCEEAAGEVYDGGRMVGTLGEFVDLFVVCGDPENPQSEIVKNYASAFVEVLLRTKATAKAAATVVLSFLDDVTEAHATPSSACYLDIVAEALSIANIDDNSDNNDGNDCNDNGGDELCLLDALDRHVKKMATYPEASLMAMHGDSNVPECPVCKEDGMSASTYHDITTLCTRDMIQVLPTSATFMFSTRHRSFHPPQESSSSSSRPSLPPPLFVEGICAIIPPYANKLLKEFSISVAYRPPAGSSPTSADEPKWVMISKVKGAVSNTLGYIACGLHIVGMKIEVTGLADEKESPLKCPVCGNGITSLVCKKCKTFALETMVCIKTGLITPVKNRLESEESAENEEKSLMKDLSSIATTTLPTFHPNN